MFILFCLISNLLAATPQHVTVKATKGSVRRLRAEINFARPQPGMTVPTSMTKSKELTHPEPFTMKVTKREIGFLAKYTPQQAHWRSAQQLEIGEILRTEIASFIHLELPDRTEIVAGPESTFELTSLEGTGNTRTLKLRFLKGSFEWRVPAAVNGPEQVIVETPNTVIHHRGKKGADARFGTECLIKLSRDEERVTTTEILCPHGSVAVDHYKPLSNGVAFINTNIVAPGSVLTVMGRHGLGLEVLQKEIPAADLPALTARLRVPHAH